MIASPGLQCAEDVTGQQGPAPAAPCPIGGTLLAADDAGSQRPHPLDRGFPGRQLTSPVPAGQQVPSSTNFDEV